MSPGTRLQEALALAARVHGDQRRKGTGIPYITHLLAVCALVGEHGGDEDQMIAALLHDTLEDRPELVSLASLAEQFGWRVANIVLGCSDCTSKPKPPWAERKRAYVAHLRTDGADIKLVSCADKLHNARALVRDLRTVGPVMWSRFNASAEEQCWYLRECVRALADGWSHPMLGELDETVGALERACGVRAP
jgi:(p)ppGpp synthase/HD superfamily hydrolase